MSTNANRNTNDRKLSQLFRLAQRTLGVVFEGEMGDPLLSQVVLLDVMPAEQGNGLLVIVGPASGAETLSRFQMENALQHASGKLRSILAESINRKRVPLLSFMAYGFKES